MLRDIGFIACSELVEAIVRYHHSTLKSSDCPTDLPPDVLQCVNIALACNRLEELVTAQTRVRKRRRWRLSELRRRRGYWPQEEAELLARLLSN